MKRWILALYIGVLPRIVLAQTPPPSSSPFQVYCDAMGATVCGDGAAFLIHVAIRIATLILQLIGGVAVLAVIYGGLKLITSGEEGKDEAKNIIQYALIGLVLAVLAVSIVNFVAGFVSQVAGS